MSRAAEPQAPDGGPGAALGAQAPTRRFVTLAVTAFAVALWMFVPMRIFRSQLPGGSVEAAVENVTAGDTGERWFSFYLAILGWGHIPAFFLILLIGTILTVHSLVASWREPLDAQGLPRAGRDQDRYVPLGLLFFGALVIGVLTFNASGLVVLGPEVPLWPGDYSAAQWAALGWWALALVAALGAIAGAARRRSVRQRMQGTAEARQAAEERAARIEQELSGAPRAGTSRGGRGKQTADDGGTRGDGGTPTGVEEGTGGGTSVGGGSSAGAEKGAGGEASPSSVLALVAGAGGLGPLGLVAGAVGWRGRRGTSWPGVLGVSLSAVQTTVLAVALALALATG